MGMPQATSTFSIARRISALDSAKVFPFSVVMMLDISSRFSSRKFLSLKRNLLEENLEELSRIITTENGKTFAESKAEMRRGIENVEVACGIPMMMQGYNL